MDVVIEARGRGARTARPWVVTAVVALAAAGALHLAAAADSVGGSDLVIAFFLAVATAQLGTAVWLTVEARATGRPGPLVLVAVAAGTAVLLALYLVAHTTALLDGATAAPASPVEAGHAHGAPVESGSALAGVGELLGPATVAVEMVLLLALVALLPARPRRVTVNGIATLGALAWASWFAGILA